MKDVISKHAEMCNRAWSLLGQLLPAPELLPLPTTTIFDTHVLTVSLSRALHSMENIQRTITYPQERLNGHELSNWTLLISAIYIFSWATWQKSYLHPFRSLPVEFYRFTSIFSIARQLFSNTGLGVKIFQRN